MKTSRNGTLFIARREALVLTAYKDGEHHSIGFGHNDWVILPGDTIDVAQAFKLLKQDLFPREARVAALLKQPVEQHQFDALVSLHYQSGNRYMPAVVALVNARELRVASKLFPLCAYNKAGEWSEGLEKRRILEQRMFETGEYGGLEPIPMWRGDPRTTKPGSYTLQEGDL